MTDRAPNGANRGQPCRCAASLSARLLSEPSGAIALFACRPPRRVRIIARAAWLAVSMLGGLPVDRSWCARGVMWPPVTQGLDLPRESTAGLCFVDGLVSFAALLAGRCELVRSQCRVGLLPAG